jgi:catechol-2,3-dioxygenase
MATLGLNHYNLRAPRELLDRIKDFYCEAVGLVPGPRPPFRLPGYWLYAGDRAVLHLVEAPESETREAHVCGTFDHVAFTCTEPEATAAHLEKLGIAFQQAVVPATRCLQFFLNDPAGNGVELNFDDGAGVAR